MFIGHSGTEPLHSPNFIFDTKIIPVGASILAKIIEERFENHSSKLLPIFFEMQSTFLSGIYKRYGDLEGGQIVIYFARNLHLKVMRKREEDLDFCLLYTSPSPRDS